MHDILIALVFVSMVASPAIVAAWPAKDEEDEPDGRLETAQISAASPMNAR
jgi:hypothetical protein